MSRCWNITIEGNIGAGKSTLLKALQEHSDVTVFPEPLEKWLNVDGINLFGRFLEEPTRWGHTFQMYGFLTVMENNIQPCPTRIRVMERSIHTYHNCFVRRAFEVGSLLPFENTICREMYEFCQKTNPLDIDLAFYLRTSPEVALERIKKRGRLEERNMTLDLITEWHNRHEEWLLGPMGKECYRRIEILDGNKSVSEIVKDIFDIIGSK